MLFITWRVTTAEKLAAVRVRLVRNAYQCRSLSTTGNKEELIDRLFVDIAKDTTTSSRPRTKCVRHFNAASVHTGAYGVIPSHALLRVRPSREHAPYGGLSSWSMAVVMTTMASLMKQVHVTTLLDLSASLHTFN